MHAGCGLLGEPGCVILRGLRRFAIERERHDPSHFIDVDYDDFVANPIGTIESVYERIGSQLTAETRADRTALQAEPRGPAHRYDLADFGLTAAEVDAAFA